MVTAHHYSAAHPSATNKKFVEAFEKANNEHAAELHGRRRLRRHARDLRRRSKATKGAGGEALLAAMKGQIFESPRGPVLIDAQTRDIVQDIYIRKVERVGRASCTTSSSTCIKAVKDPGKAK